MKFLILAVQAVHTLEKIFQIAINAIQVILNFPQLEIIVKIVKKDVKYALN